MKRPVPRTVLVAIAVAAVLALGAYTLVEGSHTQCVLGSSLGTTALYSPLALANTPYNGSSELNLSGAGPSYTFTSGSLTVTSDPMVGSAMSNYNGNRSGPDPWGWFLDLNWTVFSVANQTGFSSASGSCTQPYVATVATSLTPGNAANYQTQTFELPLPNPMSDRGEPTSLPGLPSVSFYNGLDPNLANVTSHEGGGPTYYPYYESLDTCAAHAPFPLARQATGGFGVPVGVPMHDGGSNATAHGVLTWRGGEGTGPPATYDIPGPLGVWSFASVGAPFPQTPSDQAGVQGLYALSYSPCMSGPI